jgi:TatD DNase family protein
MKYFDAHCHVQFDAFYDDQDAIIEKMKEEEIGGLVVGIDLESSKKAVALAESHDNLFAAIGLHPNYEKKEWFDSTPYRELAQNPKVVAIGECGLDYYRPEQMNEETKKGQRAILDDQIQLVAELDKPLVIHSRPTPGTMDAYEDLISILQKAKMANSNLRGDVHFFVGGIDEMKALTALGFTISFTAVITFARDYDLVIKETPIESILSETDAPYVSPASRRRERNDPMSVKDVVHTIAEVRGEDAEMVRTTLLENSKRLFKLPTV